MSNTSSHSLKLIHVNTACEQCRVRELCLPTQLDDEAVSLIDKLVVRREPLKKGDYLYRTGDKFQGIYAVQYGALKTYGITIDGREQITGFHLAGEVVGLDALDESIHPCNAVALEKTEICQLPFEKLESLFHDLPSLCGNMSRIMSREILREERVLLMLGGTSAEQRLARFLLNLRKRMAERELSVDQFRLCMSRQDISNYLGLALETVSRQFTQFQDRGLLDIHNRSIRILQIERLQELAE